MAHIKRRYFELLQKKFIQVILFLILQDFLRKFAKLIPGLISRPKDFKI